MTGEWTGRILRFEWDDGNLYKTWSKHSVTPSEAQEIFLHEPLLVVRDAAHSTREARYMALGKTTEDRKLFVVFTIRGDALRIVSARPMSRKERQAYEKEEA